MVEPENSNLTWVHFIFFFPDIGLSLYEACLRAMGLPGSAKCLPEVMKWWAFIKSSNNYISLIQLNVFTYIATQNLQMVKESYAGLVIKTVEQPFSPDC